MCRSVNFFLISLFFPLSAFSQLSNAYLTAPYSVNEHWIFSSNFDTTSGNWRYIAPLPKRLYGVTCYYWRDSNKVFICGGADTAGVPQRACYFYNIQTNSYELKDSLPMGRALGKLVRVKDSLYLVGSIGSNWNAPDGALFKYDPAADEWVTKAPTPVPALHEMAVCVWMDNLIVTIGGSTNGFNGSTRSVRIYDPSENLWRILSDTSSFPITTTSAHAECIDSTIVVMGGFGVTFNNTYYRAYIHLENIDGLMWWDTARATPYGFGVYRVGGGQWEDYMLFGPALRDTTCYGQIWGFNIIDSTWRRFLPNTIDTAGNRPTIAVIPTQDSVFLYLFGGILNTTLAVTANSERYAFGIPLIGITSKDQGVPRQYQLYQNYPNPFNPVTKIKFDVPTPLNPPEGGKVGHLSLRIYDILGREVSVLLNEPLNAGTYEVVFDGSNLSSGVYFYKLITADYTQTRKMILMK